jgi:hypothetical protein
MKRFLRLYGFILGAVGLPGSVAIGLATGLVGFWVAAAVSVLFAAVVAGITVAENP